MRLAQRPGLFIHICCFSGVQQNLRNKDFVVIWVNIDILKTPKKIVISLSLKMYFIANKHLGLNKEMYLKLLNIYCLLRALCFVCCPLLYLTLVIQHEYREELELIFLIKSQIDHIALLFLCQFYNKEFVSNVYICVCV